MQEAVEAYQETAKVAAPPRQLEASLLLKAATQLQDVRDTWSDDDLDPRCPLVTAAGKVGS